MHKYILLIWSSIVCLNAFGQHTFWVSGYVTDSATGEPLINATVYNTNNYKGTTTNTVGYFTLPLITNDTISINVSFVGYKTSPIMLTQAKDTLLNIGLNQGLEISSIDVVAKNRETNTGNIIGMDSKLASQIPTLLGEQDLARVLHLMPGVQSGKEGTGGLFVRGGSNDQNLILLDGMPIYNANHLGGFISVFNPSSINHMELHKGGFPTRFGGRLSSILDIQMKNGNLSERHGGYTIGTLSTSAFYEGPIKQDTSSFIISGRRTLFDLFIKGYNLLDNGGDQDGGYTLSDINLKYNKKYKEGSRLYLSFYKGRDKIYRKNTSLSTDETIESKLDYKNHWGNTLVSARLNKRLGNKSAANFVIGYSGYEYEVDQLVSQKENNFDGSRQTEHRSNMSQWLFSSQFETTFSDKHNLQYGIKSAIQSFRPNNLTFTERENGTIKNKTYSGDSLIKVPEATIYFSDKYTVSEKVKINMGIRITNLWLEGKHNLLPEPRFNLTYKSNTNSKLHLSYSRMGQFIHLVSSNDQGFSSDLWFPSTNTIKPETSNQFTTGFARSFEKEQNYECSVDLYFKTMNNLLEPNHSFSVLGGNQNWESSLETGGIGRAYGAEFLAKKTSGKTTGWVSYTLSKNERRFETIDNGDWFPFKYDRRHELAFVLNHQFNKQLSFSANWVFNSGEVRNLPAFKYLLDVQQFAEDYIYDTYVEAHSYYNRNSFRTPAYHRLDFSFNYSQLKRYGESTWSAGLYNAYNSTNAFYYFFAKNDQGDIKLHALTLFPIMPSISYSFKF